MTKILLISNDKNSRLVFEKTLTLCGFIVHSASESSMAWKFLTEIRFDFIMIDMQLKDESGLAFYKALRQIGNNLPVLMLGEGELDSFVLKDLSYDNYDYILKPFMFKELKLKINALMEGEASKKRIMSYGDFKFDTRQQLLMFRDKLLQLSHLELDILILLAQKSGEVIHPKKITKMLEAQGKIYSMSIFFHISKLRKKLEACGADTLNIHFIKDQGYKLTAGRCV